MATLGRLAGIWRYPVKSMGGEPVDSGIIRKMGLAGDRCWAVINSETREICTAKRWPELLNFHATLQASEELTESGFGGDVPDVCIGCPDGSVLDGRAIETSAALTSQLGRPASLAPLEPPENRNHYRLAEARTEASMANELQLQEGESLPDYSTISEELMMALADCVTPPGSYVDAFPIHLLTTNSLQYLGEQGGVEAIQQRFRPNLLIEPAEQRAELTENGWLDCRVKIGDAVLRIDSRTVRCSMPSREQHWCGVKAEKRMTRAMVDHCERHLGVNVLVEEEGRVSVGDELLLLS